MWRNSLFLVSGHTSTPFTVTPKIWRADIEAFVEAPEGLWRPVNATVADESASDAAPEGMYGHTATMLVTDNSEPDEVRRSGGGVRFVGVGCPGTSVFGNMIF